MTDHRIGYICVILAALCWGLHGALAKFLFEGGMTPALLVQLRLTMSLIILFPLLMIFKRGLFIISLRDLPLFFTFGMIGIAINFYLYYDAIEKITVAMAIFLQYLSPTLIALYWMIRGNRPSAATVIAIAVSLVGCFLVVRAYDVNFLNLNRMGVLAGLGAAVAWACQSLHAEHLGKKYQSATMLFYGLLFACVFWNILYSPAQMLTLPFSPKNIWGTLYVAVFGTLVPAFLFFKGIALMGATRASVIATVEPVAAAVFAYFLVQETLGLPQIIGGILVVASIVVLQLRPVAPTAEPVLPLEL